MATKTKNLNATQHPDDLQSLLKLKARYGELMVEFQADLAGVKADHDKCFEYYVKISGEANANVLNLITSYKEKIMALHNHINRGLEPSTDQAENSEIEAKTLH